MNDLVNAGVCFGIALVGMTLVAMRRRNEKLRMQQKREEWSHRPPDPKG